MTAATTKLGPEAAARLRDALEASGANAMHRDIQAAMKAKLVQNALGRATMLEQVQHSREAELSRLRAISGPQPHRHAPHAEVEMSGVMSSADWAAWNEATIDVFLAGIRARHAITSDSDAQPHPSAD